MRSVSRPLLAAALVCALPLTAAAQPEPLSRPFRGLFGSGGSNPNSQQSLALGVSVFGSYDDDVLSEARRSPTRGVQERGYFAGATAQLSYARATDAIDFSAQASAMLRYHPERRDLSAAGIFGGAAMRVPVGARMRLEAGVRGFRAPYYQLGLLAPSGSEENAATFIGDAYALHRRDAIGLSSHLAISRSFTTRTSVAARYRYHLIDYSDNGYDRSDHQGGVAFHHRITRYSTLRLGYEYRAYGLDVDGRPLEEHNFLAGVDYARPWSLSGRRTELTVRPGWSLVRTGEQMRLRATGSAVLSHQIGRSWAAQAEYARGMQFLDGLDLYMFSDRVTGGVNGLLGRRIDAVLSAGFNTGGYGRARTGRLDTYFGSAQLRVALTRLLAAYAQYFYYVYDFDRPDLLPAWFNGHLERQGVRVGLTAHVPLVR